MSHRNGLRYRGFDFVYMPQNHITLYSRESDMIADKMVQTAIDKTRMTESIRHNKPFVGKQSNIQGFVLSNISYHIFYKTLVGAKKFRTTQSCIGCGACAKVCPLSNIRMENSKPVWSNRCTHCMACISLCPKNAIEYGTVTVGRQRNRCICFNEKMLKEKENMLDFISVNTHSSIRISDEKIIYIDPFRIQNEPHDADIILITHSHYDHFSPEDIRRVMRKDTVIVCPKSITAAKDLGLELMNVSPHEAFTVKEISMETAVNVKVGDNVNVGDILLTLDSSDVEKSLSDAQTSLDNSVKRNELSASDAARNVSDAKQTQSFQVDTAKKTRDNAKDDYEDARKSYNSAKKKLEKLKTAEENAKAEWESAKANASSGQDTSVTPSGEEQAGAGTETAGAQTAGAQTAGIQNTDGAAQITNGAASTTDGAAQVSGTTATDTVTALENAYNTAVAERKQQEELVSTLKQQMETAKKNYETQKDSYEQIVYSQNSSVASAESNRQSTLLSQDTSSQESQVRQYEKQYNDATVEAPFSGMITAVNYEVGDTYTAGTTLLTLQDCSAYEIEAEIGEYDISDISVGQQVIIKTDATGDYEMNGTVSEVSPVSTASESGNASTSTGGMSGGGSDVNYRIRISIGNPSDKLRLDMSASLSIIVEEHENALTVPYNAVKTDENGNAYIEVLRDGKETEKVNVTVVMESKYYTEISGEGLRDGMKVVIEKEQESSNPFGNMPRGGGF